jgi:HK97 family phage prohead protease
MAAVGLLKIGDYVSWDIRNPNILARVVMVEGELTTVQIYELEDGVYRQTKELLTMNVLTLEVVPNPGKVSDKVEEVEAEEYENPGAVIVDIDGTLIRGGQPNEQVLRYLETFENDYLVVLTARAESTREQTQAEIDFLDYDELIMKSDSTQSNAEFKRAEAEKLQESYNVMIAIDDNNDNLRVFRELGITSLHPNEVPDVREERQVNLTPPAYMRAAARRGLKYYEEGKGGSGLVEKTIREARAMASGNVTADKWVRIAAWIARHLGDLDAPDANPNSDNYPSAGVVAHLLWGSGPSKSSARRTLKYAQGVVARLEEENRNLISQESEKMAKIENRTNEVKFELRQAENGDGMTFTGYAAVFNAPSQPLPFIERIAPGAFKRSLKARNDIKLLWNHDTGAVLGSTRAGTLKLEEDSYGLRVTATLPDTSLGKDVRTLVQRGDVSAMSFGFSVPANGDSWNTDGTERTLRSVRIHEVSIVAFPAYEQTAGTAMVRSLDKVATRAEVDVDVLADAMLAVEDGKDLTLEQAEILTKVVQRLSPQDETPAEEPSDLSSLELKKKKLELLMKRI